MFLTYFLTIDATKIENRRFLEDTFAKGQKKTHKKKELVQRKIEPKKKNVNIPYENKNHFFEKSPLPSITM